MPTLRTIAITGVLLAAGAAQAIAAGITIPAGTRIPIRLGHSLDTNRDKPGTPFIAHLSTPIRRNGQVIVPRGAVFHGHLSESKPSGRLKGRAVMSLTLDSFVLNGRKHPVATGRATRISSAHKNRNLALIGGGAGTGATIGAIAGGGVGALVGAGAGAAAGTTGAVITGKRHVHLSAETPLTFTLRRAVTIAR